MTIVPSCCDSANPQIEKLLQRMTQQLREALPSGTFGERERVALELSNEVVRRTLEQELQDIADSFGEMVEYQGSTYRRHESGGGKYFSLCGRVEVMRSTYRLMGVHNGPTIVPVELEAGIFGNATPELARNIAHGYGENHMRAHRELLEKAHRIAPPRATMERMAKHLASDTASEARYIEPKYDVSNESLQKLVRWLLAWIVPVPPWRNRAPSSPSQGKSPTFANSPHPLRSTTAWPTPQL